MIRFRMALTGLAVAAGLLVPASVAMAQSPTLTGTVRAPAAANTVYNACPSGDVCMYTTSGWTSGHPEHKYFQYGCYNLSNETGTRVIYNVQTGGATVTGYKNYGCSDPVWTFSPDHTQGWVVDITPINSISLNP